ncbi:hypothetical protein JK358_25545 [Nocardia sp. 2]|uniref:DUF222 domain-containing protein n=1 Tax=Nocardia acididurans TaxID=2802282 RepID=A0ABS1MB21_9NOCA|nr:hypothetical protein [Nocardia acididurans]MBL1077771.1 hypothetical protein [Nocardia acididurans]
MTSTHDHARTPHPDQNLGEFAEELKLLAEAVLERVEPVLRKTASDGRAEWDSCSWCPVCAAAAVVRGQHHDVVAAIAEHGTAIVTVLREALAGVPVEPVIPPDLDPESADYNPRHDHEEYTGRAGDSAGRTHDTSGRAGDSAGSDPGSAARDQDSGSDAAGDADETSGRSRFGRGPGTAKRPTGEKAGRASGQGSDKQSARPGYVPIHVTIKA